MTFKWLMKPCKIQDFSKEGADFVKLIGQLKVKCQNSLYSLETSWTADAGVTTVTKYDLFPDLDQ